MCLILANEFVGDVVGGSGRVDCAALLEKSNKESQIKQ